MFKSPAFDTRITQMTEMNLEESSTQEMSIQQSTGQNEANISYTSM